MAKERAYFILEGVRRAKASELSGMKVIRAQLQYADGKRGPIIDVPIQSLYSPKRGIEMFPPRKAKRYRSIWNAIQGGHGDLLPVIVVSPGRAGTPLKDVVFVPEDS